MHGLAMRGIEMKKIALLLIAVLMLTTVAVAGCIGGGDTPNSPYTVTLGECYVVNSISLGMDVFVSGPPEDIIVLFETEGFTSYQKVTKEALNSPRVKVILSPGNGYITKAGSYQITIRKADLSTYPVKMDGEILYRKTYQFEAPKLTISDVVAKKGMGSTTIIQFSLRNDGDLPIIIDKAIFVLDGEICNDYKKRFLLPHKTTTINYYEYSVVSSKTVRIQLFSNSELIYTYEGTMK